MVGAASSERFADIYRDALWVLGDLAVGEAAEGVAVGVELELAGVVILEGLRAAVVAVAVGFDNQPLGAPEEVDLEAADSNVDLWPWEAMLLAEPQEEMLQLAPRRLGLFHTGPQPLYLCLSNCATVLGGRNHAREVGDRLGGSRDGNPLVLGDRGLIKGAAAMNADASPPSASSRSADRNVNWTGPRVKELPQIRGAQVTEHRFLSARQNCRRPLPMPRRGSVSYCINASMEAMKPP